MKIRNIIEQALIGKKVRCRASFEGGDWYVSLYEDYMTFTIKSMNETQDYFEFEADLGNLIIYNFDEFEIL